MRDLKRVGLYFTASIPLRDELVYAKVAEMHGFTSVWQGESRTERDSTIAVAAIAAVTNRIKVGTGVLHTWTRNVVTLATSFTTLDELSDGRACLGIGALWEPMASKIGIERRKPILAVKEYVTVLRKLFAGEEVTYNGEFVRVNGVRLERRPKNVPVYVGATGFQMMETAAQVADGVLLNYLVSPQYNKEALKHIEKGALRAGRRLEDIDRPQLIAISYSHDLERAYMKARMMVTEYLAMEPHIAAASGVDVKLVEQVRSVTGGWPTTHQKLLEASSTVPDRVVENLMAVGDLETCRKKVLEYLENGCTEPLLYPVTGEVLPLIHYFSIK